MRTARLLTISHSNPCMGGGGSGPLCRQTQGRTAQLPLDVDPHMQTTPDADPLDADPLVMWPVMHTGKPTPSVDRMTYPCENITLPQTSFAGGKNQRLLWQCKTTEMVD